MYTLEWFVYTVTMKTGTQYLVTLNRALPRTLKGGQIYIRRKPADDLRDVKSRSGRGKAMKQHAVLHG
jgi:hypothetical protein